MGHTAGVDALAKRVMSRVCRALQLAAPARRLQCAKSYERGTDEQTQTRAVIAVSKKASPLIIQHCISVRIF
jgi:hypothetical protein